MSAKGRMEKSSGMEIMFTRFLKIYNVKLVRTRKN